MGRAAEQLKDFPVWTTIFMLHGVAELALGAMKLQGYYNFEKGEVIRDLKDLKDGDKKNKMYVEQRVKLMQYTRYHGLSRMALGLIAILAVAFDGVEVPVSRVDCSPWVWDLHFGTAVLLSSSSFIFQPIQTTRR